MAAKQKNYISSKKKVANYYNQLLQWCMNNNLFIRPNTEVFFVSETILMKPEYIINEKIYLDLVDERDLNEKYVEYCKMFSTSFGVLIVIPKEIMDEIHSISKRDIEKRYDIKF